MNYNLDTNKKTIWFAFIGAPNAGKSTLMNSLVGSKISIVTPKAQTTRNTLKGIITEGDVQIVIIDTPGIFQPKHSRLGKAMVSCAWNSVSDVDEVFVIVDCTKIHSEENQNLFNELARSKVRCNLVLNKIDLIDKDKLLQIAQALHAKVDFEQSFMISAKKQSGIASLIEFGTKKATRFGWYFAEDDLTTAPLRFMAAEMIREKLFLYTYEELPYNLDVRVEKWQDKEKVCVINAIVLVKTQSHKAMVIGQHGSMLKKVGMAARYDIEKLLDKKIFLEIHVKVEDWDKHISSKTLMQF